MMRWCEGLHSSKLIVICKCDQHSCDGLTQRVSVSVQVLNQRRKRLAVLCPQKICACMHACMKSAGVENCGTHLNPPFACFQILPASRAASFAIILALPSPSPPFKASCLTCFVTLVRQELT